jgi:hypothetical protein
LDVPIAIGRKIGRQFKPIHPLRETHSSIHPLIHSALIGWLDDWMYARQNKTHSSIHPYRANSLIHFIHSSIPVTAYFLVLFTLFYF